PIMYRLSRRPALFALVSLLYNPFTTTGPALLRTRETAESGGFHEGMAYFEDWSLSIALAVRGRVRMLSDEGRHYRLHGDSLSLGHLDSPDQTAWFRGLRERAREDPATPRWLRACLPLVRLHHELRVRRRVRASKGQGLYASVLSQNEGGPPPASG
ncbi:MAG: hypothetical protein Q7T55_18205, partial [Solirubrobacteraceae bacterium]|nr:hypothetical protein [Solirubrobacteraceae bacterium]